MPGSCLVVYLYVNSVIGAIPINKIQVFIAKNLSSKSVLNITGDCSLKNPKNN